MKQEKIIKREYEFREIKSSILILKPKGSIPTEIKNKEYKRILNEFESGIINVGNYFDYEFRDMTRIIYGIKE